MSDLLLTAIGARGELSLNKFDESFTEICLKDTAYDSETDFRNIRRKAIRLLDALGFCEFSFETSKVYACPPTLVALPGGGVVRTVLTGVRSPEMVKRVKSFRKRHSGSVSLVTEPQNIIEFSGGRKNVLATLPSAFLIEGLEKDLLLELASHCGIQTSLDVPAAWALLNFSIALQQYSEGIEWDRTRADELNWVQSGFSPDSLKFQRKAFGEPTEGLVEYIDPLTNQRSHWFWLDDKAAIVDRDWGRYLALSQTGKRVLRYDDRKQLLVVPASLPLPRFLARAATLCSGKAPVLTPTGGNAIGDIPASFLVNIYAGVPPQYSSLLASKLGQRPIVKQVHLDKNGLVLS